jgi:hypothetical protein
LITLIYAGWLPPDLAASWSCLSLHAGVSAAAYSLRVNKDSPDRGRIPEGPKKLFVFFFFICSLLFFRF